MWNFCLCPVVTGERKDTRHQSSVCHEWGWQPRNGSSSSSGCPKPPRSYMSAVGLLGLSETGSSPIVSGEQARGPENFQTSSRVGDDAQILALG